MNIQKISELRRTLTKIKDKDLPIKTAYKLLKINQIAIKEGENYDQLLQQVIKNYAQKDEQGNYKFSDGKQSILIQPDKIEEANKKIEELSEIEVEIPYKFTIEEFNNLDISLQDLDSFIELIEE